MRSSFLSSRFSILVVGFLVLLLAVLATLQYRWIAQVSDAEKIRLETTLRREMDAFCKEFDRGIGDTVAVFDVKQPNDDEVLAQLLAERLRDWRSEATWPGLIKDLFVIRLQNAGEVVLLGLNETSRALEPCDWDDDLLPIRNRLNNPGVGIPVVSGFLPGMILAIQEPRHPRGEPPFQRQPPRDHLVIRFDLRFIAGTILPRLAESHFGGASGIDYALMVSSASRPGEIVFQSGLKGSRPSAKPDAVARLFGLQPPGDFTNPLAGGPGAERNRPRWNPQHEVRPPRQGGARPGPPPMTDNGRWILEVWHPAGSLEDVVESARRRNLLVSLLILTMLGITTLLLLISTRRVQQLARQQMDFVATISHELRTPLTAIRSAGQNLADGIISDPPRVRDYGLLIEREGSRLTEMIGRVLAFAGIRSGRQNFQMAAVDLAGIIEAVLADWRWTLEEKNIEVEMCIAPDLPPMHGDAGALRLVLTNLIDNAIKYGAAGRWLGVSADFDPSDDSSEVWVSVSDHGPGIPRREQRHLFEAFRRGAEAAAGTIPGSGLGLAVVRGVVDAHDGSIDLKSSPGKGTIFVVRFPVAPAEVVSRGTP